MKIEIRIIADVRADKPLPGILETLAGAEDIIYSRCTKTTDFPRRIEAETMTITISRMSEITK